MSQRPPHQPIAARCPRCGNPLQVPDERAQLVVCPACDSHLTLEGPTRDVLRLLDPEGNPRKGNYGLAIGQRFQYRGAAYEVIAREFWVEEDDPRYSTRVYTLYHPRRALMTLEDYRGTWSLMSRVHVMPKGRPRGSFRTHDGRKWRVDEVIQPELWHVDGCLPWVARVGDRVTETECSSGRLRYTIEQAEGETEYSSGKTLLPRELRRAMPDAKVVAHKPGPSLSEQKSRAGWLMAAGALGVVLHGLLAGFAAFSGKTVTAQEFRAQDLAGEVTSQPFALGPGLARLELSAPLDDAWMAVDVALLRGDEDTVVHVTDADISYYSGVEGGESWSEGSTSSDILLRIPEAAAYRLHVAAVSNTGETETATTSLHPLRVRVVSGARSAVPGVLGLGLSGLMFVLGILWSKTLSEQ